MGIISMIWILVNAQSDMASGAFTFPRKPLNTDNCTYNFTRSDVFNSTLQSYDSDE